MTMPAAVDAAFRSYPAPARGRLLRLRALILDTAAGLPDVGPLEEVLRWGQPAYLTPRGSGSTIRLGLTGDGTPALFVHCRTRLIETFRPLAPPGMRFEGTRAVLLDQENRPVEESLALLIRAALTYHRRSERVAG